METARSEISAKYCEILIKKGIHRLKKLNLNNRIADARKHGTNLIYRDLDSAIKELGETLVLDMLNHNLRYRFEQNIPLFKLCETTDRDLIIAEENWIKMKYEKQWKSRIDKEGFSFSYPSDRGVLPRRELTSLEKRDEEFQRECRKRQREKSLDNYDPDADQPEVIKLESLNERKLKNLEIQHEDSEKSEKDENLK